ncbi:MAG: tetraacyldisaccharide 4'-kinase [Bacteroidaceae bacterium]|nr:tetraacyldisaccharide 4'-kinase [Bacteroidaceae bacterium]
MNYLLIPFAWIYDFITSIRNMMYDHGLLKQQSFDKPLICIGNLAVGGSGKTPHTEYLINLLSQNGYKVAVLSRGYKRKTKGFVLATDQSTAEEIGDEPLQMKKKFPNIVMAVDEDRCDGVSKIIDKVDVVLLDDAFQHRKIKAGLNIILSDYNKPYYKDYLMPAGRLRENQSGNKRAEIIIMTKCRQEHISTDDIKYNSTKLGLSENQQLFFTGIKYGKLSNGLELRDLANYNIVLVTGIANPKPLEEELSKHVTMMKTIRFSDHHNFTDSELKKIDDTFANLPSDKKRLIITTEKDFTRLGNLSNIDYLCSIPIEVNILNDDKLKFDNLILDYCKQYKKN